MEKNLKKLYALDEKISSLNYSMALVSWDGQTLAPKQSAMGRAKSMMTLSDVYFTTLINDETNDILSHLEGEKEQLSDVDKMKVKLYRESYDQIAKIPKEEFVAFSEAKSLSSVAWQEAKSKSDFSVFAPHLEKMISYTKKNVDYLEKDGKRYDVLLDMYEKDLTMKDVDIFFDYLKSEIVPLVSNIKKTKIKGEFKFLKKSYKIKDQKKLVNHIVDLMGFDLERGLIGESEHPFTCNLNQDDVRFSVHYYKNDFRSAVLSAFHECGHALYEQNVSSDFANTMLSNGTSMGIHESQSRFYENHVALSEDYLKNFYGVLQDVYPSIVKGVNFDDFNLGMNRVKPSLIRVEADEVTYPLHVMVRYEMEKMMIENEMDVNELPSLWNKKYKEYLGIMPKNDAQGILQDVHWSEALFGYFPSYALGSAYSAQFYHTMNKEFNVAQNISQNNLVNILGWLRENIHQYGRMKTPKEIILDATGESFNPKYYTDYIKEKYRRLYKI